MSNDANGTTWSEAEPALTDPRYLGQQEIRGLRTGVRQRIKKEHDDLTAGGTFPGGEHKAGSAKAYRQDTPGPTLRPDGTTALGVGDVGRLWIDSTGTTEKLKIWDGAAWVDPTPVVTAARQTTNIVASIFSAGGWTNNLGVLVLVHAACRPPAGTSVEVDYNDGNGFNNIMEAVNVGGSDVAIFGSFLVPSNGKIRINPSGLNPSYVRVQKFA